MNRYIYFVVSMLFFLASCSDDDNESSKPIDAHFSSVLTETSELPTINIDKDKLTIDIEFSEWVDLSKLKITFLMPKSVALVSPSQSPAILDLTNPVDVVVNYNGKDITYKVQATCPEMDHFISISTEIVEIPTIDINRDQLTIDIGFKRWVDLSNLKVTFNPNETVSMVSPAESPAVLDATKPVNVVVNHNGKEITYTLQATCPALVDPLTKGWTVETSFDGLPDYLKVYKSPATLAGKTINAYIAIADLNAGAKLEILGDATGAKTPDQFFVSAGSPKLVINAGFFGWSASLGFNSVSLIIRNSFKLDDNSASVKRDGKTYYPTRSAFGMETNGDASINWVYNVNGSIYAYPNPSMNDLAQLPLAMPSSTYPSNGWRWNPKCAIGAGPVLVKNGSIKNHFNAELFDGISPEINRARSAIGILKDGRLLFFVCEEKTASKGLTLQDVAQVLLNLECKDALNLDGGGSTCMLLNGEETVLPNGGTQRAVSTTIAIY